MQYHYLPTTESGYDAQDPTSYIVVQVYPDGRKRNVSQSQDMLADWLAAGNTPNVRPYDATELHRALRSTNYRFRPDLKPAPVDNRTPQEKANAEVRALSGSLDHVLAAAGNAAARTRLANAIQAIRDTHGV